MDMDQFVNLTSRYKVSFTRCFILTRTGEYHPMRQSDCLRWLFFPESAGCRQVSAHCLSYARLLYPYFRIVDQRAFHHYLVTDFFSQRICFSNFTNISISHSTQSPFLRSGYLSVCIRFPGSLHQFAIYLQNNLAPVRNTEEQRKRFLL